MKIYVLNNDVDKYRWLNPVNRNNFDKLSTMRGQSFLHNWITLKIETTVDDKEDDLKRPYGDYPSFAEPLVSEKAKIVFEDKLKKKAEFLEVIADNQFHFYIMNVTNVLDCLDEKKSKINYFDEGGIMDIKKYTFNGAISDDELIFRIKGYEKKIYVTDQFKKIVEKNDLIGFSFQSTDDIPENPFADLIKKKKKNTKK